MITAAEQVANRIDDLQTLKKDLKKVLKTIDPNLYHDFAGVANRIKEVDKCIQNINAFWKMSKLDLTEDQKAQAAKFLTQWMIKEC